MAIFQFVEFGLGGGPLFVFRRIPQSDQKIGHPSHCRDDDQARVSPARPHEPGDVQNPLGRSDRGAAELENVGHRTGARVATRPCARSSSALSSAAPAPPRTVLWTRTVNFRSKAGSGRRRPTVTVMPFPASTSRAGCGRSRSSRTAIGRAGAEGSFNRCGPDHGRGRRQARRRLPGDRRPAEGLRRSPGDRHAAGRVGHRRHRDRLGAARLPAYLVAAGIFALAYFSFGFLLLRANSAGFSVKDVVLLYALFNAACVIAAPFVGKLGDRIGRTRIVVLSYLIYLVMSLGFAFAMAKWQILLVFVIYGVFYSIDEAQSKAFIADVEPERRATAIGVYNFLTGVIYLPASLIAGALWAVHPSIVFIVAAFLSLAAITAFVWLRPADNST